MAIGIAETVAVEAAKVRVRMAVMVDEYIILVNEWRFLLGFFEIVCGF